MTEKRNSLDNNSIASKLKELILILVFTLISAAVAILLSNLVIFPITYYSINNVNVFNIYFKYSFILFIIITCSLLLLFKVRSLHKDGNSAGAILAYIFLRPVKFFGFFLLSSVLVWALFFILYTIFSNNYYLIYKLSGGV